MIMIYSNQSSVNNQICNIIKYKASNTVHQ